MRVFFSGIERSYIKDLPPNSNVLVSYDQPRQYGAINELHKRGHKIMLDSGAFATFNSGKPARCAKEYAMLVKKHKHQLVGAVAMDVIGGTMEENLDSLDVMESISGIKDKIWPVYHEGDDWALLQEYLDRGYNVISIGAIASRGKQSLIQWIDEVFKRFPPCGFGGKHHYHGLAMTQSVILNEYKDRFYTVDSTSWLNLQRYGLKGGNYLLKNRSPSFYRKIGMMAVNDMASNDSKNGKTIRHPEQISAFDYGI